MQKSDTPPVEPPVDPVIETPNEVPDLPFGAWLPKTALLPTSYEEVPVSTGLKAVDISINFSKRITKVSRYVNGNNANCFTGWMQNDAGLIKNINNLKMGVMRIPGGSLSDVYFWNRKGIYENYAIKSYDPPLLDIPSTISPWIRKKSPGF